MGGCVQVTCENYASLFKGLEHLQILVSAVVEQFPVDTEEQL